MSSDKPSGTSLVKHNTISEGQEIIQTDLTKSLPKNKNKEKIKKKKLATRQWHGVVSDDESCEAVDDSSWINFSDENPSQICSRQTPGSDTCICQRLRPGGESSQKCGVCTMAFLPTTVDGVSLEQVKEKRKNEPPKKRLQESPQEETSDTKPGPAGLQWVEVTVGDTCDSVTETSSYNQGSPSALCQTQTAPNLDLKCLCVLKNGSVKNVCGICTMTLKIAK